MALDSASHVYDDSGTYTAAVTVTDPSGEFDSRTFRVTVANAAPTSTIDGAPTSSPEGSLLSLGARATDASNADMQAGFTFTWNVTKNGMAFAAGSGATIEFTPDDNGEYVVTLMAL